MKTKLNLRVVALTALIIAVVTIFCGCEALLAPKAKTFEKDEFSITLNENFFEKENIALTAYYESPNMICTLTKESFETLSVLGYGAESTLEDYTKLVILANSLNAEPQKDENGNQYFTYEKEVEGKNFTYKAYTFKGSKAFYLVQFAVETKNAETLSGKIVEYAKSIIVK